MFFKVGDELIKFLEESNNTNVTSKVIFDNSTADFAIQQIEVRN